MLFKRSQLRLRYAVSYFLFFAIRQNTQYFHPFDSQNIIQSKCNQQSSKKDQQ